MRGDERERECVREKIEIEQENKRERKDSQSNGKEYK